MAKFIPCRRSKTVSSFLNALIPQVTVSPWNCPCALQWDDLRTEGHSSNAAPWSFRSGLRKSGLRFLSRNSRSLRPITTLCGRLRRFLHGTMHWPSMKQVQSRKRFAFCLTPTLALSSANSLVIARGTPLPFLSRSPPGECTVGACCVPRATIRSGSEHRRCRNQESSLGQWRESPSCPWSQRFPASTRDFSAGTQRAKDEAHCKSVESLIWLEKENFSGQSLQVPHLLE